METAPNETQENKGLKKAWRRLSGVFKGKSTTSPSPPESTPSDIPKPTQDFHQSESSKDQPQPTTAEPAQEVLDIDPATQDLETTKAQEDMAPTRTDVDKRVQKARDTMTKHGIEFNEADLSIPELSRNRHSYDRVHRSIRMRVRYTCHNCSTVYGHDRVCVSCQHKKCPQCIRYPPRKSEMNARREDALAAAINQEDKENSELTECPCHECQTIVQTGIDECPQCHHKICERCLKEAMLTMSGDEQSTTKPTTMKPMESATPFTATVEAT